MKNQSTSLSLLKGGGQAVNAELDKGAQGSIEENDVVVLEELDDDGLKALLFKYDVSQPKDWTKMSLEDKRSWCETALSGDAGKSDTTPTPAPAQATVEEAKTGVMVPAKPAKKAAKGKAVVVAAQDGEVVGPDVLQDMVHEIENMKETEALELVDSLNEQSEVTFFKLGGVLSVIISNQWFSPYDNFRDFVEKKHGILYRRAMYWVDIYQRLSSCGVQWHQVSKIGWTKLKEIAKVINADNVEDWVALAAQNNTINLIEMVKATLTKDTPKAIEDQASKTVMSKTFKMHEDQKVTIEAAIEKAKEQSGTQVDTAALEFVCLDYLGGQSVAQKLKQMGLTAALSALEAAFPSTSITVDVGEEAA